ncbi:MAG: glycosyltransferase family 4 protein [Firmicutes bacterium]|nr:glycosyltransferase family 4 protein [Bacillota bacterium]
MNVALLAYPVSDDYRRRFEKHIGVSPEYWKVGEMRRWPWRKIWRRLRSFKPEALYVPVEESDSLALVSLLKLIAAVTRARRLVLVTPELESRPFRRWEAVIGLLGLGWASLNGQYHLWRCRIEMNQMARQASSRPAPRRAILVNKRRILYIKSNLWYGVKAGGSVGHVAGVVNEFLRRGYEVDFVASERPALVSSGRIRFYQAPPLKYYGLPSEINLYRFSRLLRRQIRELSGPGGLKPDFIYQRMSVGDVSGALLAREFKTPLILEYNGSEVWAFDNWGTSLKYRETALLAENISLSFADLIVVVSEALRDELISRAIPPGKIFTYPNCIDPVLYNPGRFSRHDLAALRNKHGVGADAVVATFIGTFGAWHGIEILAQAIRQLVDEDEEWVQSNRVHFMLIGDGLKMPLVREILTGAKYRPYYTLTGLVPQDQGPLYLAAADILLSPHVANRDGSRFFGSPTKLFEYMAMGKGIVASDLEQIGQVLKNSIHAGALPKEPPQNGQPELAVLCKPGDVEDIIRGVRFLTENLKWRTCLGENARREALAKYTWDRQISALLERISQMKLEGAR